MGIDIRNSGSDDSDDDATTSGGPWYVTGSLSGGIVGGAGTSGSTSGQTAAPVPGSAQWNQLLQNAINSMNSMGQASSPGFSSNPKIHDVFAVDFLGFNFGSVNVHGTPNIDIMEDAVLAVAGVKRTKQGWEPFDIALLDDQDSDVARIVHRQMDEQLAHGDIFDMNVRYYDDQGNETSTMHLVDCEFIAVETDPLNSISTLSGSKQLKLVVTVQPKLVRYS